MMRKFNLNKYYKGCKLHDRFIFPLFTLIISFKKKRTIGRNV